MSLASRIRVLGLVLVLLATFGVGNAWADETVDITSLGTQSWSNYSLTSGVVTISTNVNGGSSPTTSSAQYRWKTGNIITIEVSSGNVITSIQFKTNSTETYGPKCLSYNNSAITSSGTNYTWEAPSGISSAAFSVTSEARLTEIHVTYAEGSGSGSGGGQGGGNEQNTINTNPTYDFSQIEGLSNWGTSYSEHSVEYTEATVTFVSANKSGQTITDVPVTKGNPVELVLNSTCAASYDIQNVSPARQIIL